MRPLLKSVPLFCARVGKFRTEKDDLRRIIHPDQNDDDRCRRAVSRFKALVADVKPNQKLSELERYGRNRRPEPYVASPNIRIRQPLEHHCEQES